MADVIGFHYTLKNEAGEVLESSDGGDLLSRALRQSTIGAERLNDRVRNGIGWGPLAIATRLMQSILRKLPG